MNYSPEGQGRIFCIGLPKTGLTSLLLTLLSLGYDGKGRTRALSRHFFAGRHREILEFYDKHQVFADHPTFLMYKLAFERYGRDARFILTTRHSSQVWFESLKRHNTYAHPIKHKHRKTFGRFYPHGFDQEHKAYYERHIEEVERFFADQGAEDRLLTLSVDAPDAVPRLLEFLGVESDLTEFPHANQSRPRNKSIGNRIKEHYNALAQPLYGAVAPVIFRAPARVALPPETTPPAS